MLLQVAKVTTGVVAVATGGAALTVLANGNDSGFLRFGRAATTGLKIIIDYKRTMRRLPVEQNAEYSKTMSEVHQRSAERLLELCCHNGGCFIKVGQHIGSLDYLLPKEYVNTLKVLYDDAPETSRNEILQVIREDLGQEVLTQFETFSDRPVGTASLAQVHKAVLKDGTVLAVKVQHPNVMANSFVDINTMEILVKTVAWIFPTFSLLWLAEETKRNLPLELDFEFEGKNAERVSEMLHYIPFLKVSNNLSLMYSEMIFKHGFVHCDPHPGNVLVKKTPEHNAQIVLLDHGLYTTLTSDFRLSYAELWMSIIKGDESGIRKHSEAMNCGDLYGLFSCMVAGRAWSSISKRKLETGEANPNEDQEIQDNAAELVSEMVTVLNKVPREMLLIFKTNDCLRGIDSRLCTRFRANAFISMTRSCTSVVFEDRIRHAAGWWQQLRLRVERTVALLVIEFTQLAIRLFYTDRPQSITGGPAL